MKLIVVIACIITVQHCIIINDVWVKSKKINLDNIDSLITKGDLNNFNSLNEFDVIDEEYSDFFLSLYYRLNFFRIGFNIFYYDYFYSVKGAKFHKIYVCPSFLESYNSRRRNEKYNLREKFFRYNIEIYQLINVIVIRRSVYIPLGFLAPPTSECLILFGKVDDDKKKIEVKEIYLMLNEDNPNE